MTKDRLVAATAAALIVVSAGLAQQGTQPGTAPGQQPDLDRRQQIEQRPLLGEQPRADAQRPWGTVARGGDIIGATIVDINNENVGSVNDLIVQPHTGHIAYAIITHGGFLGIGANYIAVPWQALQVRPDLDRTYQINLTQERLEQAPSFDEDNLPLLDQPGWFESTDKFFGTTKRDTRWGTGGWGMQGRLQQHWDEGEQTTISGNITKVDRQSPHEGISEGLVVSIQTADGQERLVHLGPAWYLEGQVAELREGQQVEVQAREIAMEDRVVILAESVRLEQGTLALRDQQGQPVWDAMSRDQRGILAAPEERDFDRDFDRDDPLRRPVQPRQDPDRPGMGEPEPFMPRPGDERPGAQQMGDKLGAAYVRASDLRGKNVRSFEQENIGTVNELAVDLNTGRVPFVIAGFGGFLGIGETEVVLPWQALTFLTHEDRFMLAVEEQQLRTAPRLERDQLSRLEDPAFRQEVYSHFGIDPTFATYEHAPTPGMQQRQPWAQEGQLQQQYMQGEEVEIRGTVTNVGQGEVTPGAAQAVVVRIRDRQGQEHISKLGPAWFLQRQDFMVRAGEEMGIEGRKIELNGEQVILAKSVRTFQAGLALRDEQGRPRWDALQRGERHLGIEEQRDRPDQPDEPQDPMDPHHPGHDPQDPPPPPGGN
jgi:sporulation protein YlmC with PRC-barrel domain